MRHLARLCSFLALTLTPLSAKAADPGVPAAIAVPEPTGLGGFYAGIRGGFNWMQGTSFSLGPIGTESQSYRTGTAFSGVFGFQGTRIMGALVPRVEAELGTLNNRIDAQDFSAFGHFSGAQAFGATRALYGLLNGYVDYPFQAGDDALTPFAGAGIGFGNVRLSNQGAAPVGVTLNDHDTVFAWNLATGLGYTLQNGLTIEAMYRYLRFEDVGLRTFSNVESRTDLPSHQFMIGTRYRF